MRFAPLLLILSAVSAFSYSAEHTDLVDQLRQCQAVTDNNQRLQCFDKLSIQVTAKPVPELTEKAQTPVATAQEPEPQSEAQAQQTLPAKAVVKANPPVTPEPTQPAQLGTKELFGFEQLVVEKTPKQLVARVEKIKRNPYGQWTITLDNGQKWRQTDSRKFRLKAQQQVVIRKAALGSFMLNIDGRNSSTRVKRVK